MSFGRKTGWQAEREPGCLSLSLSNFVSILSPSLSLFLFLYLRAVSGSLFVSLICKKTKNKTCA